MSNFLRDGYQVIKQLLDREMIDELINAIFCLPNTESNYGIRDLHRKASAVNELAYSKLVLNEIKHCVSHQKFKLIKAIYFNKHVQHNWSVPWHQDKTIAVQNKVMLPGYKNWTVKQGVPHVQPPLKVLQKITTMRIALDDADENNGGLKIIPRSHILGVLSQAEINQVARQQSWSCSLKAGDALIMHPLIIHSSNKSTTHNQRRTIHLEYSSGDLPQDIAWY